MGNSKTKLSYPESLKYLKDLITDENKDLEIINVKKKIISIKDKNSDELLYLRLPLSFPELNIEQTFDQFVEAVPEKFPPPYIILLIRAGNSSLGYFEKGKNIKHKVIRRYMVRKKQGKTQLTYLKRKGKSRLGSRIRLAQAEKFFEEINELLNEWNLIKKNSEFKIFYSCPIRLWSYLFKTNPTPPFNKKNNRLIKIPFNVYKPNMKELKRINYTLNNGIIFYKL